MTFLPIVARELRVASRRNATYWSRSAMAVLTIGVANLARAAEVLAANGVAAERRGGHLGVPAEDALGIGLEFIAL